jgi:4-alpha-glucanotransferase
MLNQRSSGILLHPTSLPGKYGIGTLGSEAFRFIDFLARSRQKLWQILPLGPTGYADSPYQSFSSSAGNPLLIDFDLLVKEGLLKSEDLLSEKFPVEGPVDFGKLIPVKYKMLKSAYDVFRSSDSVDYKKGFLNFTHLNDSWLKDYSFFMALKDHFQQKPWYEWEKPLKMRDPSTLYDYQTLLTKEIDFYKFIQYLFFKQWFAVKDYAHQMKIRIIGDIPLFVAYDSVDVWVHPEIFLLDKDLAPISVGGVPPDYFSETGQLWGNPLYNWSAILKDEGKWWIDRIRDNLTLYDIIRIDHFRGFVACWSVPYGEETAVNGKWIPSPGKELFDYITHSLGNVPVIAEDLGVITKEVEELRDSNGFPGMKILQFAFDSGEANDHLPYNFSRNCIVYTGTHDNDTISGWFDTASTDDKSFLLDYLNSDGLDVAWDLIRLAWASVSNTAIVPMQDLLALETDARMNLPGTIENNWRWRANSESFSNDLAEKLAKITELYGRNQKKNPTKKKEK